MIDYTEELFNAIKTISKKEIEALKFDTTIEATITDVSNAKYGAYVVTNGSVYFTAYSMSTDYKVKDIVLVTIPMGDYNQQKTIIGKKNKSGNDVPIAYTSPFSQIIDVTNNLASNENFPIGMIANGDDYKWENLNEDEYINFNKYQHNLIWSARQYNIEAINDLNEIFDTISINFNNENKDVVYNQEYYTLLDYSEEVDLYFDDYFHFTGKSNDDIENLKKCVLSSDVLKITDGFEEETGITRIGLKADFRTLLKQYNVLFGNYGLILCVGFRNPDQLDQKNITYSNIIQPFVFDSKDFFGNIYNFETDYTQEAVFDVSEYSNLILSDIFLFAYQKNNFKNNSGNFIEVAQEPNIFINNIYVCAGNERENFNTDSLKITSLSPSFYNEENKNKAISLRWIHKDEQTDTIKSLTQQDFDTMYSNEYKIRWYIDALSSPSPDKFTEQHWNKIDNNDNKFQLNYEISSQDILDTQSKKIQVAVIKLDSDGNELYLIARSNILEFNNYNYANKGLTVQDINALGVRFEDSEKGYYFMYNSMNQLENKEDIVIRELTAVFGDNLDNISSKSEITTYDRITWIFPSENSMIIPLNYQQSKITTSLFNNGIILSNGEREISYIDNEYSYKMTYNDDLKQYKIIHDFNPDFDESNSTYKNNHFYTIIPYQINKTLNFSNQRNTVYLELEKDGQTYIGQATMHFNTAGTSGSEYTMIINWNRQDVVFDISKTDEELSGEIILLNPRGQETSINNSGAEYIYNWYKYNGEDSNLEIITSWDGLTDNPNNYKFKIKRKENKTVDINELYILEIKLINFGNYDLITRMPIPLTQLGNQFKVNQIEGPIQVRYSTDGTLSFDKTPYNISFQTYDENNQEWIKIEDSSDVGYWKLIPENTLGASLINNTPSTINNIIAFFIKNNAEQIIENEEQKKRLLYRLIINTTDNEIQNNSLVLKNLKDFSNFNITNNLKELINQLNTDYKEQLNYKQIYNEETGIIQADIFNNYVNRYQSFFNTNDKIDNLLKLLYRIAGYSEFYNGSVTTLTGLLKDGNWNNFWNKFQLIPSNFYIDNFDLYGIQYIYNQTLPEVELWTQPIYIYQDSYPSPTLNQWSGKLIIDDDANTILAKGMSAGRKNEDNTFSGVMFGDWSNDSVDTPLTGIYGFHNGNITYALKEDGSAFFGNEKGKISLNDDQAVELKVQDNNNLVQIKPGSILIQSERKDLLKITKENNKDIYLLQSKNFSIDDQEGMQFNLSEGKIQGYNFSLLSKSLKNNINYSLELSSGNDNNLSFLRIGRKVLDDQNLLLEDSNDLSANFKVNIFKTNLETYQDNIITLYYEYFLSLITDFKWFYNIDDTLYKTQSDNINIHTDEKIYENLLIFPYRYMKTNDTNIILNKDYYIYDNVNGYTKIINPQIENISNYYEKQIFTRENLQNYILEQEKYKNNTNMIEENENNEFILKNDWYFNWNFDEIPNTLLTLLSEEQLITIKNILQEFTIINQINNIELDRNLFYPKLPLYIYQNSDFVKNLLNKILQPYKSYAPNTINNIKKINQEAEKLINEFNLSSLDYTYKTKTIDNQEYAYIDFFDKTICHINNIGGTTVTHTGYYIQKGNSSQRYTYAQGRFNKNTTYIFGNSEGNTLYNISLSVDPDSNITILEKEGDQNFYTSVGNIIGSLSSSNLESAGIKYKNTIIDIYLLLGSEFANPSELATAKQQLIDFYQLDKAVQRTNPSALVIGIKIRPSNSLIGLQKINGQIQEKINNYYNILLKCQQLISFTDNDFHIWLYDNYYAKVHSAIQDISTKYNNILLNDIDDELYIKIPFDFDFRQQLEISEEEINNIYYYNETSLEQCPLANFYYNKKNKVYSFKKDDVQIYYIKLDNKIPIKGYAYLYNWTESSNNGYFHHDDFANRLYYSPLTYFTISSLALSIFEESEKLYYQSTTLSNENNNLTTYIFDKKSWENDLININKNGGYLTSKNYRPTIYDTDKQIIKPTNYQNQGSTGWGQGMKGMIIDLTNDRIVLGNNAEIQGFQTQYYPGQTNIAHRSFIISTGAKFLTQPSGRDKLAQANDNYFIIGRSGYTSSSGGTLNSIIFGIKWDGSIIGEYIYSNKKWFYQGHEVISRKCNVFTLNGRSNVLQIIQPPSDLEDGDYSIFLVKNI